MRGRSTRAERTLRLLSNVAAEDLQRPPFSAPLAAKELRERARLSPRVVISAQCARDIANVLDPQNPLPDEGTP